MGKWYDKIFIGNPNKEDFSAKDLPKTRMEQFFDVIKLRFGGLIFSNLFVALFALPLIIWAMYNWFLFTEMDREQAVGVVSDPQMWLFFLGGCIPLYTLIGPAQAGMYYCLRNWIWNRRATVGDHFWKEFKRSWKQSAFFNFFNAALFYAGVWWVFLCYLNMERYPILKYAAILLIFLLALYYMSSIYQFPQLVTYNLKIGQIFKNSFIYLLAQFPRTLLANVAYLLLIVACFMLGSVLMAVAMSIGISFVCLANMILSDYLFDRYVNAPEDKRKGMAPLD